MKSWQERFENNKRYPIKLIEKDFADMKAGDRMYISTPQEISDELNKLKTGQFITIKELRNILAKKHRTDTACPVTTGIFTRIVAERSLELMSHNLEPVAPFWRVIDPSSPLAKKLSCSPNFLMAMRQKELNK